MPRFDEPCACSRHRTRSWVRLRMHRRGARRSPSQSCACQRALRPFSARRSRPVRSLVEPHTPNLRPSPACDPEEISHPWPRNDQSARRRRGVCALQNARTGCHHGFCSL